MTNLKNIRKLLKKGFKIFIALILVLIFINLSLYVLFVSENSFMNEKSLVILVQPDKAYLFVHGFSGSHLNGDLTHCILNNSDNSKKLNPEEINSYACYGGDFNDICDIETFDNKSYEVSYSCVKDHYSYAHYTVLGNKDVKTIDFLNNLNEMGYTKIFGTWCDAGDNENIIEYANGDIIPWNEDIKRKTKPGKTIPIFYGLGFILL